jgi:hypothetical protein
MHMEMEKKKKTPEDNPVSIFACEPDALRREYIGTINTGIAE